MVQRKLSSCNSACCFLDYLCSKRRFVCISWSAALVKAWGKPTSRKLRTRSGRVVKVKRRCGEWCRLCYNNSRRWFKTKKYKNLFAKQGRKVTSKKLKQDLKDDKDFRKRWRSEVDEAAHLLAGGRSRIRSGGVRVDQVDEVIHDLIDDSLVFYSLAKYKVCESCMGSRLVGQSLDSSSSPKSNLSPGRGPI